MTKLPEERRLSSVILRGELKDHHVRSIAREIAKMHADARSVLDPDGPSSYDIHVRNWESALSNAAQYVGSILDVDDHERVSTLARTYLSSHQHVFENRQDQGYIKSCHGGLSADRIFLLEDGPKILSYEAPSQEALIGDVLSDVATLATDLHRLARPQAVARLLRYYREFSGETHPASLAHLSIGRRALAECAEACERVVHGEPDWVPQARMYHRIVLNQLERAAAHLVLIGGEADPGRLATSREVADYLGWQLLTFDDTRRDIAPPDTPDKIYDELLRRAELLLDAGESIILDAPWPAAEVRERGSRIADSHDAKFVQLQCSIGNVRPADQWPSATSINTDQLSAGALRDALSAILDRIDVRVSSPHRHLTSPAPADSR